MDLKDVKQIVQLTKEFNATHKNEVQRDAYQHRFKNLGVSFLFCCGFGGGMVAAYIYKNYFNIASWYILMMVLGFLLLFALIMLINYIVIIVKNKKPPSP